MLKLKDFSEYICVSNDEREFLLKKGIKYVFVKSEDDITIWKYKKTSDLYKALAEYQEILK